MKRFEIFMIHITPNKQLILPCYCQSELVNRLNPSYLFSVIILQNIFYFRTNYSHHESQFTPLFITARVCNSELCKYVAARTEDYKNEVDLHSAVAIGYKYESFKLILENVHNKNPRDDFGETPLHQAAREGCFEICNLIIENVTEKNPKDHQGKTPTSPCC